MSEDGRRDEEARGMTMRGRWARTLKPAFVLAYAFFYLGFLCHRSRPAYFAGYSWPHLIFLSFLATGFFLPSILTAVRATFTGRIALAAFSSVLAAATVGIYWTSERTPEGASWTGAAREVAAKPERAEGYRVLILGEPVTIDDGGNFVGALETNLGTAGPSSRFDILDATAVWHTTADSLAAYDSDLRRWEPDVVLVMPGINDLCRPWLVPGSPGPRDPRWRELYQPFLPGGVSDSLSARLVQRLGLDAWFSMFRLRERDIPWLEYGAIGPAMERLRTLVRKARADGSFSIVMVQPYLYRAGLEPRQLDALWIGESNCRQSLGPFRYEHPSAESLGRAMRRMNYLVRGVATSEHAALVDLDQELDAELSMFVDDVHLTIPGARRAADLVARTILAQLGEASARSPRAERDRSRR